MEIYRGWINQPSTMQPLHALHGWRCIVVETTAETRLYFTEGDTISMQAPHGCVSRESNHA